MEEPTNILNSIMFVTAGGFIAVVTGLVTNIYTARFKGRKEIRELKAKNYFERQVKSIEAVSDCLVGIILYSHFKLSELSPNEHYVFSIVMSEVENASLQQKHMELEKIIIIETLYLPMKIEEQLNEFSNALSLTKNIEFHDDILDGPDFKEAGYEGILEKAQSVLNEIKRYVREDYVGINE